jgi:hypothetical protein
MASKQKTRIGEIEVEKGMRCLSCRYTYNFVDKSVRCDCMNEPNYEIMVILKESDFKKLAEGAA